MTKPTCPRDVIDQWPSLKEFADDIGVEYGTAKAARRRNSIPDEWRPRVIEKARARGIRGVTFESLTIMNINPAMVPRQPDHVA